MFAFAMLLLDPEALACDPDDPAASALPEPSVPIARRLRVVPNPAAPRRRDYDGPTAVPAAHAPADGSPHGVTLLSASPIERASGPEYAANGPPPSAVPIAVVRPPDLTPAPIPTPAPAAEADADADVEATKPAAESKPKWFDRVSIGVLADVYANVNYNFPGSRRGPNFGRTMETSNGFAIAWFGADAAIEGEQAGGLISLRFGPGAANYAGPDNGSFLQNVKQGYVYWKPKLAKAKLSMEMGKFDSPFGLEVGDSYLNMHYTRPTLYTLGQPFFHTGIRIKATLTPKLGVNLLAVNGWNNSVDNNRGKSFGAQLALTPHPKVGVYLGYLGGPENGASADVTCDAGTAFDGSSGVCVEQTGAAGETVSVEVRHENRVVRHLVDLVATFAPTDKLTLGLNGDFIYDRIIANPVTGATRRAVWLGGFLSARYALTDKWAIAGRGEFFQDLDGYLTATGVDTIIGTGTTTIEFAPVRFLVMRLENRIDHSNQAVYARGPTAMARTMITTTLGVVLKSF